MSCPGGQHGYVTRADFDLVSALSHDSLLQRDRSDEGDGRSELQVVRITENCLDRSPLDGIDKLCALLEPWAEHRMLQVRLGLLTRSNPILLGHGAVPQSFQLR